MRSERTSAPNHSLGCHVGSAEADHHPRRCRLVTAAVGPTTAPKSLDMPVTATCMWWTARIAVRGRSATVAACACDGAGAGSGRSPRPHPACAPPGPMAHPPSCGQPPAAVAPACSCSGSGARPCSLLGHGIAGPAPMRAAGRAASVPSVERRARSATAPSPEGQSRARSDADDDPEYSHEPGQQADLDGVERAEHDHKASARVPARRSPRLTCAREPLVRSSAALTDCRARPSRQRRNQVVRRGPGRPWPAPLALDMAGISTRGSRTGCEPSWPCRERG